jgi:plastocyanin
MKCAFIVSCVMALLLHWPGPLNAHSLTVQLLNQQQQPLADAVIELKPLSAAPVSPEHNQPARSKVAQQELTFIPFVSAISVGSQVDFPNFDRTRHHVYSFSPAKVFEIQLYADTPEAPITFDKTGIVALGCNIHDYMQAYIYVGHTDLVAVTNTDGQAVLPQLADGRYQLLLWHPWQIASPEVTEFEVSTDLTLSKTLTIDLQQRKPAPPQRGFGR